MRADRGVERELNSIKIECYSCSWNGSYKDYQVFLLQIIKRNFKRMRMILFLGTFARKPRVFKMF